MKEFTPADVLALAMQDNDADAKTVRDYLKALVATLWREGEGFSGKRPFGNSGWDWDLHRPLVVAGFAAGTVDEDGEISGHDARECDKIIAAAIEAL